MEARDFFVKTKSRLFASSALMIAALAAGNAWAQTPVVTGAAQAAPAGQLQEVVVTAERRETTVQRTAATLAVVNSATLQRQRVANLSDLNSVLLNTQIVPIVAATQVSIRGIGSNFVDPRADPAVAVSVNGLFYARPLPVGFGFLDVSRVEDLEGPQGTLYGRNAAAGALNIITNMPSNRFGGSVQVTGGNLGENKVTGIVNVPVNDDLAFRVAYDRDRRDGYIGGYYNDINSDTGRISARWTPTDRLTIYGETNYIHLGGHGGYAGSWPCPGASAWSLYVPNSCSPSVAFPGGYAPKNGKDASFVKSDQVHVDYDLGWAKLTSISGYVGAHDRLSHLPDGTYFQAHNITDSNDYSEELRIAGHDVATHRGGLAWQVGAYLFASTGDYFYNVQAATNRPPTSTVIYSKIPQSSESGYAQATYGVSDQLRITGGIRFTSDSKGLDYESLAYPAPLFNKLTPSGVGSGKAVSQKWTYKAGVEYDLAHGKLLYANISSGFVAAGINGGNSSAPLAPSVTPSAFQPETITAYEAGSKNRFLDNRLQLNGDVYYYDFQNFQYLYPSLIQGGGSVSGLVIQNAASAKVYGVEASAEFALTRDDRINASVAWAHATFGALSVNSYPPPFGPAKTTVVAAGSPLVNDPDWSGLVGYEHTFRLSQGASITLSANTKLSSKYLLVVGSSDPSDYQKGYAMTDASAAYHWPDDKYELRLWVKNLENVPVNVYGQGATYHIYGIEPPRTYGVSATAKF